MAVLFMDGYDYYNTVSQRYEVVSLSNAGLSISNDGRFGANAIGIRGDSYASTGVQKILASNYQTLIVGVAFYLYSTTDAFDLLALMDGTSAQVNIGLSSGTRKLEVRRGGGPGTGTLLGTGSTTLMLNTWYYIEAKVKIDPSTGTVEVRLNGNSGSPEISLTGQNTRNTANSYANRLQLGYTVFGGSFPRMLWDDVYVCDTTGSPTNDFLGDVRIETKYPSGAGNSAQFTPSAGSNYQCVDETPPNDDTDYVEDGTVGHKDTYAYQDLTATAGTVYAVQICPRARKTDAGLRSIQSIARLSGTEVNSADDVLASSYQYFWDLRETKPGGGAWTITDFNNAEFGPYVSA